MQRRSSETVTITLDRYRRLCWIRSWMAFHEIPFVIANLKPDPDQANSVNEHEWTDLRSMSADGAASTNENLHRRKHFISHRKKEFPLSLFVFIVDVRSRSFALLAWSRSGLLRYISAVHLVQWEPLPCAIRSLDSAHARGRAMQIVMHAESRSVFGYYHLRCLLSFPSLSCCVNLSKAERYRLAEACLAVVNYGVDGMKVRLTSFCFLRRPETSFPFVSSFIDLFKFTSL